MTEQQPQPTKVQLARATHIVTERVAAHATKCARCSVSTGGTLLPGCTPGERLVRLSKALQRLVDDPTRDLDREYVLTTAPQYVQKLLRAEPAQIPLPSKAYSLDDIASADYIARGEPAGTARLRRTLANITPDTLVGDGNDADCTMLELALRHVETGAKVQDAWHWAVSDLVFGGFTVRRRKKETQS